MRPGKIIRRIAMLLSLVMLITSTIGTTYCYIVTKTDPIANVFVPEVSAVNGLTISKIVDHSLGEDYIIPDNISFDFNVELGSFYAKSKLKTSDGEMTADESGTLSVTVKPGKDFCIEGIKEGTEVKVTEKTTDLKGFANKGDSTQTVTVGSDGKANVTFINKYTPDAVKPENVTVSGIKHLEGRDWKDGDSFTFILEGQDGEGWKKLGEATVTYDDKNADFNKFDFTEIFKTVSLDSVGTHSFRISEAIGSLEDIDYDKTVNYFLLLAADADMDGKLELKTVEGTENIKVTETDGSYAVEVVFNNTFAPQIKPDPTPVNVQLDITKKVNNIGKATHGKGGFQFVLKNTATSEGMTATSNDNGQAAFTLTYTKADIDKTYTYKLSETNLGLAGMTYDTDVYEITVAITLSEDNKLVTSLTMDGKTVDELKATFRNTYDSDVPPGPVTGDRSNLKFWIILFIISATMLVTLIVYDIYDRKKAK